MFTISVPLYVTKNKKGEKWYLNLNNYRNTHFQSLNGYKKKYKDDVTPIIASNLLRIDEPIKITYTVYVPTKRLFDISNVCSIVDKFLCDVLTELGIIEDDNYLYVPEITYKFGGIDKTNPRCDILIEKA